MMTKKYEKETNSFVDKNGNAVRYDLQTSLWAEGDEFEGYIVSPMNSGPDIDPSRDPEAYNAWYKKVEKDAKRYFEEHPERLKKGSPGGTVTYLWCQIEDHLRDKQEKGEPLSNLEKVYLHSLDNPTRTDCYCWEQIQGEISLDASHDEVAAALMKDSVRADIKAEYQAFNESAARGGVSLENRVAEAQNVRYDIRMRKRGDNGSTMTVEQVPEKEDDRMLSEDEKNFLVKRKIEQLSRGE